YLFNQSVVMSTNHIVRSYDQHIDEISNNLVNMASHAVKLLNLFNKAIINPKAEDWWQQASTIDKNINQLDTNVEQRASELLSLRQPMGSDFRLAISAIKMTVIYERIGDLAKNAVRRVQENGYKLATDDLESLQHMTEAVIDMVTLSGNAIKFADLAIVTNQHENDETVDKTYHNLMRSSIKNMQQPKIDSEYYLQLILVIKNIERIGDYANRIAKIAYYIHTGDRIYNHNLKN
ncbi:MAG: phosphate signaling complex protein PhoU, partial [Pseudomonadota bacterium]